MLGRWIQRSWDAELLDAELRCNACACERYSETDGSSEMETGSASATDGVSFPATTLAADIARPASDDIQYSLTCAPPDEDAARRRRREQFCIPVITVTFAY